MPARGPQCPPVQPATAPAVRKTRPADQTASPVPLRSAAVPCQKPPPESPYSKAKNSRQVDSESPPPAPHRAAAGPQTARSAASETLANPFGVEKPLCAAPFRGSLIVQISTQLTLQRISRSLTAFASKRLKDPFRVRIVLATRTFRSQQHSNRESQPLTQQSLPTIRRHSDPKCHAPSRNSLRGKRLKLWKTPPTAHARPM